MISRLPDKQDIAVKADGCQTCWLSSFSWSKDLKKRRLFIDELRQAGDGLMMKSGGTLPM